LIKYLGSKKKLLDSISQCVGSFPEVTSVMDLFSGTSRVGHTLKTRGYQVFANDHNAYASTLARCYVQADLDEWNEEATQIIRELNSLPGQPGYFTETFCENARYFQPKNGERVDAIREEIAKKDLHPELEAIVLVSLMEAADRVDSTTGVQMAFLKKWAQRSFNDLEMRVPALVPRSPNGKGSATQLDAIDAVHSLSADVAYIDPPYNQHSYLGNYHIWETLVLWDKPEVYGIANKRTDVRTRKSVYNSKPAFKKAFEQLLRSVRAKGMVISFSDEGYISRDEMVEIVNSLYDGKASVSVVTHDYKRYVGAQIGIHDLTGKRVGEVSHLRNSEFLFVVSGPDFPSDIQALQEEIPTLF